MRYNAGFISSLCYANLIALGALLIVHVLSFFGIGAFGFAVWGVFLLVGFPLMAIAYGRQVDRLYDHLHYEPRHPFKLFDVRNYRYAEIEHQAIWRYRATANVTMPFAPGWLVRLPAIALLVAFVYFIFQLYLLVKYPAGIDVILWRLMGIWNAPFFLYPLPILYSWRREFNTSHPV
jgi:hypothetical protein